MTVPFNQLPDNTRTWVYTANRLLTSEEVSWIASELEQFTKDWSSHGTPLKAAASVFDQAIIVIAVEDGWTAASGCSIDKSVGILKLIEKELNITLFDRMLSLYKEQEGSEVIFMSLSALKKSIQNKAISLDSLIVNTQADSLGHIKTGLWTPIKDTWLAKLPQLI